MFAAGTCARFFRCRCTTLIGVHDEEDDDRNRYRGGCVDGRLGCECRKRRCKDEIDNRKIGNRCEPVDRREFPEEISSLARPLRHAPLPSLPPPRLLPALSPVLQQLRLLSAAVRLLWRRPWYLVQLRYRRISRLVINDKEPAAMRALCLSRTLTDRGGLRLAAN